MYTGTMIEDLITSVQRAEAHAGAEPVAGESKPPVRVDVHATYSYEFTYADDLLGVA